MQKLHKYIFNINGCTIVKMAQEENAVTATVRLTKGFANRCCRCDRRGRLYDNGRERRKWWTLDLGLRKAYIEMDTYRIMCPKCGVHTVKVPC